MPIWVLAIVCDTNVLRAELAGTSGPWQVLIERLRRREVRLVVPELVWLELQQLVIERLAEAYSHWRRGTDDLRRLGAEPPPWPQADEARRRAALSAVDTIRKIFSAAGGETPGIPDVTHAEMVRRALARRRPFDAGGKDGYRDALLWETVLSLAESGQRVMLVSSDARAFATSKGEPDRLHPHLAADVAARAAGGGAVELARSLGHAAELVDADAALARSLVDRLLSGGGLVAEIMQELSEQAEGKVLPGELLRRLGWSSFVVDAEVSTITDLHDFGVVSAARIDAERTAAEVSAGFTVALYLRFRDTPEAVRALAPEPSLELEGHDFRDDLLQAYLERQIVVRAGIVLDTESEQLLSARLLGLDMPWLPSEVPGQLRFGFP